MIMQWREAGNEKVSAGKVATDSNQIRFYQIWGLLCRCCSVRVCMHSLLHVGVVCRTQSERSAQEMARLTLRDRWRGPRCITTHALRDMSTYQWGRGASSIGAFKVWMSCPQIRFNQIWPQVTKPYLETNICKINREFNIIGSWSF